MTLSVLAAFGRIRKRSGLARVSHLATQDGIRHTVLTQQWLFQRSVDHFNSDLRRNLAYPLAQTATKR